MKVSSIIFALTDKHKMGKQFLIGLLFLLSTYGYSQDNKHKIMINGGISYSTHKSKNPIKYSSTGYDNAIAYSSSAHAQIGYFISANFALGITGSFMSYKNQIRSNYDLEKVYLYKERSNYMSFFVRYNYIGKHKLGCFLNLNTGYRWGKWFSRQTYTDPQNNIIELTDFSRAEGMEFNLYPGIIYFINKSISVETRLGHATYYTGNKKDKISDSKNSSFTAGFSMMNSFNLNFSFYLGGKNQNKKYTTNEDNL